MEVNKVKIPGTMDGDEDTDDQNCYTYFYIMLYLLFLPSYLSSTKLMH